MWQGLSNLFDSQNFMPHGHCFLWQPNILWLHVVSDAIIFVSYYSIPVALVYFARKRPDMPFRLLFGLFSLFILLCGTTHIFSIWVLWHADYGPEGIVKALTAVVSLVSAVLVWKLMPQLLTVPSPSKWERLNAELLLNQEDITQRVEERTLQLAEANAKLEEAHKLADNANAAKSDFLANMSHEIRTPLNSMIGLTELVLESELNPNQENHLRMVLHSAEDLIEIINDILDFSKIESGKLELDPVPFDLHTAIEETAELFAPKAREKELQLELLTCFMPETPRYVIGDRVRIRQILSNLLGNAIKFTQGGYILVTTEEVREDLPADDIKIKISVRDTGIGIPQDKLKVIFDKFSQADVSTTRKFGGTGLGLSICRQLARMMRGEIIAESTEGEGSIFSATMVLQRDRTVQEETAAPDRTLLQGKKALIVDDVEPSRTILATQLAGVGIRTSCAGDSKSALRMLIEAKEAGIPFDLLITDYILPEMESDTFTRQAKILCPDMFIVMVTALAEKGYAQIFAGAGCNAYLTKPVRSEQLCDLLVMLFAARRSGKSLSMLSPSAVFRKNDALLRQGEDNEFLKDAEILLVEDNRPNRDLGIKLLENFGCRPTAACNGEEAIEIVTKQPFDLILMDCQMPEMDGFEASSLLCAMKRKGEIPDISIIALTANAMKGDREKCMESGMNDYISKPLRKTALRNALMQWLPPKKRRAAMRR